MLSRINLDSFLYCLAALFVNFTVHVMFHDIPYSGILSTSQQGFQQVGADKSGHPGDQPGLGGGLQLVQGLLVNAHGFT